MELLFAQGKNETPAINKTLSDIVNDTSIIEEIIPSKYMDIFIFKFSAIIGRNENDYIDRSFKWIKNWICLIDTHS